MPKPALSAGDWIEAALARLVAHGPEALRIEALARGLGVTKGSFYWHFRSVAAFRAALLARIAEAADDDLLHVAAQHESSAARLTALLEGGHGGFEAALRNWARREADAAALMARLDRRRLVMLSELLADLGQDSTRLPLLLYATQLGLSQLEASLGPQPEVAREALLRMIPVRTVA